MGINVVYFSKEESRKIMPSFSSRLEPPSFVFSMGNLRANLTSEWRLLRRGRRWLTVALCLLHNFYICGVLAR